MFSYHKTSSYLQVKETLREKCPYLELLWSVFSAIWNEYGEKLRIFLYSVRTRENKDQNNSEYKHFLRSEDFRKRFPEKSPPTNCTTRKNLKRYEREGTIPNINKGRSGRRRTGPKKQSVVRLYIENNVRNVSCKRD